MRPKSLAMVLGTWSMVAIASDRGKNAYYDLLGDPGGRRANPPGSDLNIVTPDIRDEVILYLRRYASGADADSGIKAGLGPDRTAQLILIRLGDEQTIAEMFKEREGIAAKLGKVGPAQLEPDVESAQPLLIPQLAKYFFREDGDKASIDGPSDSPGVVYPFSIGSMVSGLGIMKGSPVFSTSVREWAGAMYESVTNEKAMIQRANRGDFSDIPHVPDSNVIVPLRISMRAWWKENARSFAAKDYASVKPGASPPVPKTSAAAGSATDKNQPSATKTETPSPGPQTGEPVAVATSFSPLAYPLAIGLSALLIAITAFFMRRKNAGK